MKRQTPLAFAAAFATVALGLIAVSVGTGCQPTSGSGTGIANAGQNIPPQETDPTILPKPSATPTIGGDAAKTATVYRVVNGAEGRHLERVHLAMSSDNAESPATFALNTMAAMKDSPLPKGTKVRNVKVEGDLATVDFNDAFEKNFGSGDENEAIILNAVLATIGQFSNVHQVQILVEGKKVSLGGMQDTTEPLGVPSDIARVATGKPGEKGADSGAGH